MNRVTLIGSLMVYWCEDMDRIRDTNRLRRTGWILSRIDCFSTSQTVAHRVEEVK
jgi:hypothetical protein